MLATQVWTLREIQFPWFWGNCDFFGCARGLRFEGVFARALAVVELVTLFVDMIDNVYNHREESKFRNGDVNIVNQFMDFESGAGYVSGSGSDAATQGLVASSGDFYERMQRSISKNLFLRLEYMACNLPEIFKAFKRVLGIGGLEAVGNS